MFEQTDSIQSGMHQTADLCGKLRNEVYVLGAGTIGGAVKEAAQHPLETVGETAAMSLAGIGLAAVAAAEIPVVSALAVGTGAVYGAGYVWNLIDPNSAHNVERNRSFASAFTTAWSTSNSGKLENSIQDLQNKSGRDSLQVFEALVAGGAAAKYGARVNDVIRSMPGDMPFGLAPEGVAPAWFKGGGDKGVPTWDEFVNFKRKNGEIFTKSIENHYRDQAARAEAEAEAAKQASLKPELDKLSADATGAQAVTDQQGRTLIRDNATGELIEKNQKKPIPDDNGPANGNSFYFSDRYKH